MYIHNMNVYTLNTQKHIKQYTQPPNPLTHTYTHEPQGSIFPSRPPSLYLEQGTHGIGLLEDSRLSLAIQELIYWLVYS